MPTVEPAATPAERHLGDRLAALVDGELSHDTRERVLAHLATCDQCRSEADEQRRVKTLFAAAAAVAPAPPADLLARLQGLPGVDEDDGTGIGPLGGGLRDLAMMAEQRGPMDGPALPPVGSDKSGGGTGFRFHDFSRAARPSAHRGRRFAFAAAGAFSMAAVAFGALPADDMAPQGRSEDPGTTVTPAVARPGNGLLSSTSAQDDPIMTRQAPQTLVSVHQPMRLPPQGPVAPPGTLPGPPPSLLGASGDSPTGR